MTSSLTPAQLEYIGNLPAMIPPKGQVSNFVNPFDYEHIDYAIMAIAVALPTIVLALRLYSKIAIIRKPGIDDYVLVLGWIFYVVYCAFTAYAVQAHLGRHQWNVQVKDVFHILYGIHVASILYGITTTLVKTSILLQYLSIFNPTKNRDYMFWSCWSLIGFLVAFYGACTFAEAFSCTPIKKIWNPLILEGHCINIYALNTAAGTVNSVTDLITIVLPQRAIWKLNMSRARQLRASMIFLISLFAMAASVIRLYYAVKLSLGTDNTWNTNMMGLWTYVEFMTTIFCSCLPSLARLAKVWTPSVVAFSKKLSGVGSSQQSQPTMDIRSHTEYVSKGEKIHHVYAMREVTSSSTSEEHTLHHGSSRYSDEECLTKGV